MARPKQDTHSRDGLKGFTTYQPPETVERLKLLAAARRTTVQALVAEALELLFEKHTDQSSKT